MKPTETPGNKMQEVLQEAMNKYEELENEIKELKRENRKLKMKNQGLKGQLRQTKIGAGLNVKIAKDVKDQYEKLGEYLDRLFADVDWSYESVERITEIQDVDHYDPFEERDSISKVGDSVLVHLYNDRYVNDNYIRFTVCHIDNNEVCLIADYPYDYLHNGNIINNPKEPFKYKTACGLVFEYSFNANGHIYEGTATIPTLHNMLEECDICNFTEEEFWVNGIGDKTQDQFKKIHELISNDSIEWATDNTIDSIDDILDGKAGLACRYPHIYNSEIIMTEHYVLPFIKIQL